MTSVPVSDLEPSVVGTRRPRRWLRVVGVVVGTVLLIFGGACLFTSVETSEAPVVNCGPVAVVVMFDASQAPPGRVGDCRGDAIAQVGGGTIAFVLPGILLVAGSTLGKRRRCWQQAQIERMEQSGVWRFFRFWRVATAVIGAGPVGLLLLAALASADSALVAVAVIIGAPWATYCYLTAIRPELRFEDSGIVVVNPMSRRHLYWEDIAGLDPGYWGTRVTLRSGGSVNVWVGQKTNWARWRGTPTRADALAAAVVRQIGQRTASHSQPVVSDPGSAENRRRGLRNLVLGVAAGVVFTLVRIRLGG